MRSTSRRTGSGRGVARRPPHVFLGLSRPPRGGGSRWSRGEAERDRGIGAVEHHAATAEHDADHRLVDHRFPREPDDGSHSGASTGASEGIPSGSRAGGRPNTLALRQMRAVGAVVEESQRFQLPWCHVGHEGFANRRRAERPDPSRYGLYRHNHRPTAGEAPSDDSDALAFGQSDRDVGPGLGTN